MVNEYTGGAGEPTPGPQTPYGGQYQVGGAAPGASPPGAPYYGPGMYNPGGQSGSWGGTPAFYANPQLMYDYQMLINTNIGTTPPGGSAMGAAYSGPGSNNPGGQSGSWGGSQFYYMTGGAGESATFKPTTPQN